MKPLYIRAGSKHMLPPASPARTWVVGGDWEVVEGGGEMAEGWVVMVVVALATARGVAEANAGVEAERAKAKEVLGAEPYCKRRLRLWPCLLGCHQRRPCAAARSVAKWPG